MHTCAYPLLDPAMESPCGHTHRGNCSDLGHRGSVYSALEPHVSGMCTVSGFLTRLWVCGPRAVMCVSASCFLTAASESAGWAAPQMSGLW